MKFTKKTWKRTWRTFIQAFIPAFLVGIKEIDFSGDRDYIKGAVISLLIPTLAAAIGAAMNLEPSEMGGGTMTFDAFVKKYLGKATDVDGYAGAQCVDLAKLFIEKVLGVKPESIGNAHAYYDDFDNTYLKKHFKKITYKKGVKAQKGDLVVWGKKYNGNSKYGHIAIATGEQTATHIKTYDQNWGGKEMKEVNHSLDGIAGFLRPIDQSNITPPKKKETLPYKVGKEYKLIENLNVRKEPSINAKRVSFTELTDNGKKHAHIADGGKAVLNKGTVITVKDVKKVGSDIWVRCPSGWLCARKGKKVYIK